MKETAGEDDGELEFTSSSDERTFKVHHHADGSVQDRRASLERDLVNQFEEALVDGLVFPFTRQ